MPDYILEPIDTSASDIVQEAVDYIQGFFPEWQPSEAQLDGIMLRFFALKIATVADMASRVLRSIYMYFGATVVNIPPNPAVEAEVSTNAQTGVEMEALTAVSVAALTIYDMCKALEKGITITDVRLETKTGGKSGDYKRA